MYGQPISSVVLRGMVEEAKADPLKLIKFLEQAEDVPSQEIAYAATRIKKELVTSHAAGRIDTTRAYRFLFRHADYFAEYGGFHE